MRSSVDEPLRVAIISPTFGGYGGLEAFVLAIAEGLRDEHINVRVWFKRVAGFKLEAGLSDRISASSADIRFCDAGGWDLWAAVRWADVVHVQNAPPDVVFFARLLGTPLLINIINHKVASRGLRVRLWGLGLHVARKRFYISEYVRRSWEGAKMWEGSEVVFPISDFPLGEVPPEQRIGFTFAARWIPNKGLENLIEAYALAALDSPHTPLTILGDGPLRSTIEQRVTELKLKNVRMPGFVDSSRKAEYLRGSRFVVIPPNTGEDFGLVAMEARSVRVPCIITRDGGLPEAAGKAALICEPGDTPGLAELMRQAAEMSAESYVRMAETTRENWDRDVVGPERYRDVYLEIAR